MGYFPFFVDMEEKRCLIAGGGATALRKARQLLPFGAQIRGVAPRLLPDFEQLAADPETEGRLSLCLRPVEEADLEWADFVIAATSDRRVNSWISGWCRAHKLPVNVVDVKEECSFLFPALIRRGPVVLGLTTGGASPALASLLRERLEEVLPEGIGALAGQLGALRGRILSEIPEPQRRSRLLRRLAREGIRQGGPLSREQERELWEAAAISQGERPVTPQKEISTACSDGEEKQNDRREEKQTR